MCLYVGMGMEVQVPLEARGLEFPEAGVMGNYKPPDFGTGNQTRVLWKEQGVLLTTELSLQSLTLHLSVKSAARLGQDPC